VGPVCFITPGPFYIIEITFPPTAVDPSPMANFDWAVTPSINQVLQDAAFYRKGAPLK